MEKLNYKYKIVDRDFTHTKFIFPAMFVGHSIGSIFVAVDFFFSQRFKRPLGFLS